MKVKNPNSIPKMSSWADEETYENQIKTTDLIFAQQLTWLTFRKDPTSLSTSPRARGVNVIKTKRNNSPTDILQVEGEDVD